MGETATKWFDSKARRKEERKGKAEKLELARLAAKYEPLPYPITEKPGVPPGDKPFMSLEQMVRYQTLKLEYEYKPLREAGKSHDEAEQEVFPDVYQYRLDQEAAEKLKNEKNNEMQGDK